MPTNLALADVADLIASLGRGVVFYANKWDLSGPLVLTQLGVTEGNIVINTNPEVAKLTFPELTGPAAHEVDYTGEDPVVEVPLYMADPALQAIVSPSGSAHAGRSRRGPIKERTIVVFPESLFLELDDDGISREKVVSYDSLGAWKFDGVALSAERQTLLDASMWLWRVYFNRAPRRFLGGPGDASKNIETVSVQTLHHADMPEGHHLYTTGDPFDSDIDLNGMS